MRRLSLARRFLSTCHAIAGPGACLARLLSGRASSDLPIGRPGVILPARSGRWGMVPAIAGTACGAGRSPGTKSGRGARQGPAGPCGDAEAPFHTARRSPDGCGRADRPCLSRGALCCGGRRPPDWRVASLPATRGIECEAGGVRCLYGRTVRPGWGIRTPEAATPGGF